MADPNEVHTVQIVTYQEFEGTAAEIAAEEARMRAAAELGGTIARTTVGVLPEGDVNLARLLSQSIFKATGIVPPTQRSRVEYAFRWEGLERVSDLLVLGRWRLKGFEGVATGVLDAIDEGLESLGLPFAMKQTPTVEDAAALCEWPNIPVQVISRGRFRDIPVAGSRRVTVQDAIDATRLFCALVPHFPEVQLDGIEYKRSYKRAKGQSEHNGLVAI